MVKSEALSLSGYFKYRPNVIVGRRDCGLNDSCLKHIIDDRVQALVALLEECWGWLPS